MSKSRRSQPLRLIAGFASGSHSLVVRRSGACLRVVVYRPPTQGELFPTAEGLNVAESVLPHDWSERTH